ncbi:MAG: competence protein ComEC, partial [Xanthobacteraceae bacterium]|nr:competence protein ComEC [Xanthobacteraceae bacterium]
MAESGDRPRAGTRAAVLGTRRAAAGLAALIGARLGAAGEFFAKALRAEADAARLAPWLPVAFGIGILLYFAAPAEPLLWAPLTSVAGFGVIAWISRERPFAFAVALALAAVAAGFSAASLRAALVAHPVLTRPIATVAITGFVEARDATERSDRIVLRLTGVTGRGAERMPQRIRVSL